MVTRPVVLRRPQMSRRIRSPKHPFQLRTIPYHIQPFFIAPVLPGETMKNLSLQSRCVSDPVVNPLIGWWNEYYVFYVKLRDLDQRDEFTSMMVDPAWTPAAVKSETADSVNYFNGQVAENWIDYVQKCLERVTKCYFRNDDEAWNDYVISGRPLAQINTESWLDSVINDTDYVASPDVDITIGVDDIVTASEIDKAMFQYQHLLESGLVQMTFEEFTATYGVRLPDAEEPHKPELVRYLRDWAYPSNTIDPATGAPSSALSWSVRERADKDRRFTEHGFLFGVTVKRPKVYFRGQKGTVTSIMNDVYSWLPPMATEWGHSMMRELAAAKGPLSDNTDGYWVDLRDLFNYGEQFVNFAVTETDAGMVAVPTAALQKRYVPDLAAITALFVTPATDYYVREDGIVSMKIATGHVPRDITPQV